MEKSRICRDRQGCQHDPATQEHGRPEKTVLSSDPVIRTLDLPDQARGISADDGPCRKGFRHDRAGADHAMIADFNAGKDEASVGQPDVSADSDAGYAWWGAFADLMIVVVHDLDTVTDQAMVSDFNVTETLDAATVVYETSRSDRQARPTPDDDPYGAVQRAEADTGTKIEIAIRNDEWRATFDHDPVSDFNALESEQYGNNKSLDRSLVSFDLVSHGRHDNAVQYLVHIYRKAACPNWAMPDEIRYSSLP